MTMTTTQTKALPYPDPTRPVRVSLGGETRWATRETWQDAADELVAKHGGMPEVCDMSTGESAPAPTEAAEKPGPNATTAPAPIDMIGAGEHDMLGEARSRVGFEAAEAAGFAPAPTVFRRGLRVNDVGVDNARASRMAHDALPTVVDACRDFSDQIKGEARASTTIEVSRTRMTKKGFLAIPTSAGQAPQRFAITARAFGSLVGYHTGIGGGGYLAKCWPELRALNYNHWIQAIRQNEIALRNQLSGKALEEWQPTKIALRTRKGAPTGEPGVDREVFGVVSPSYTAFDVDKIADALALAMPKDARCTVSYDGQRASFDVQFHSNVLPKHYVAGEFFKAGIRVRTDDTGGGSIWGSASVWQNLCLNLIIIDQQTQPLFRLRHIGDVAELAKKFSDGIQRGLAKLKFFLEAWDYAVEENVLRALEVPRDIEAPTRIEDALPGIFNGIVERELVPVRGRREEVVTGLVDMWRKDTSAAAGATRGAVINAFTRYAHEVETDEFAGDEIERSVSSLLYGRNGAKPPRLPYLPLEAG